VRIRALRIVTPRQGIALGDESLAAHSRSAQCTQCKPRERRSTSRVQ
jgi:hypothetical protein